jgi:hypothetical protein
VATGIVPRVPTVTVATGIVPRVPTVTAATGIVPRVRTVTAAVVPTRIAPIVRVVDPVATATDAG